MGKTTARRDPRTMVLDEVLHMLRAELPNLEQSHGVRSLGVFGSIVRGEQRSRSDVDILVVFERTPTFFEFIELEDRLAELLGAKVDLVMRSALKPRIGDRILAEVVNV